MNRFFSKHGFLCPLTRFRWLHRSSNFRWRKWVSSEKVNINGDLLEREIEDVFSWDSGPCDSTWSHRLWGRFACWEATTLGWRQFRILISNSLACTLLPSVVWLWNSAVKMVSWEENQGKITEFSFLGKQFVWLSLYYIRKYYTSILSVVGRVRPRSRPNPTTPLWSPTHLSTLHSPI